MEAAEIETIRQRLINGVRNANHRPAVYMPEDYGGEYILVCGRSHTSRELAELARVQGMEQYKGENTKTLKTS